MCLLYFEPQEARPCVSPFHMHVSKRKRITIQRCSQPVQASYIPGVFFRNGSKHCQRTGTSLVSCAVNCDTPLASALFHLQAWKGA